MFGKLFGGKRKYLAAVILIVVVIGFRQYKKTHQPPVYETVKVNRGNLIQTVDATGNIESLNDISLRFEAPGTVAEVNYKENSEVKAGTILATLRLGELNAAVAEVNANLQQKLVGTTNEDKTYYEAAVVAAKATLEQAKFDAIKSVKIAEANVDNARNNLKLAEGGEESQIVISAYEDAVATLQGVLPKLDDAVAQSDNILGIDDKLVNDAFESYLSTRDASKLSIAESLYKQAKTERQKAREEVALLTSQSSHDLVDKALITTELSLTKVSQLLIAVSDVLKATDAIGTLTPASLDTKKTTIETNRSTIITQYTSVVNQIQNIRDAKNSLSTYTIALKKAQQELEQAEVNAVNNVKIKEAAYNQAQANWQGKINPPREVDIAALRASLAAAVAAREKAIIRAPIDGVITKVFKKVGESVSGADVAIKLLSPHYEVKVDIPETDVSKLTLDDAAIITLDALGEENKLSGKVIAIDPASTEIQDVVYYQVTVALLDTDKPIKPGMTANVSIETDARADALYVPQRAIRTRDDGGKYVRVLKNEKEQETDVKLGLRANDSKVEILGGLIEGQEVIVSVKK